MIEIFSILLGKCLTWSLPQTGHLQELPEVTVPGKVSINASSFFLQCSHVKPMLMKVMPYHHFRLYNHGAQSSRIEHREPGVFQRQWASGL
jgi:hypothetical protein